MSLDPEIADLLPALNAGFPVVETMTAPQARAVIRERLRAPADPEPVSRVIEQTVPGAAGDIPVRIYWRETARDALPVVVFAHGGGFVFCDLDTHDELRPAMTNGIAAIVVSRPNGRGPLRPKTSTRQRIGRRSTPTRWAGPDPLNSGRRQRRR